MIDLAVTPGESGVAALFYQPPLLGGDNVGGDKTHPVQIIMWLSNLLGNGGEEMTKKSRKMGKNP